MMQQRFVQQSHQHCIALHCCFLKPIAIGESEKRWQRQSRCIHSESQRCVTCRSRNTRRAQQFT